MADQSKTIRPALLAILAFALCSIAAAVRSRGFLESDGGTHYLFARHAIEQPIYFVDIWGRPLCTALFAVPARIGGLIAVRLTSLAVAIGCGLVAMAIARGEGLRSPVLALIFTLGQPLLFLHSFSELTELPFALFVGLAFLSYQRKRWWLLAIFAAILPLGRPEGFAFILLAALALVMNRQWICLVVLPVGLIVWSIAGHAMVGPAEVPWWKWLAYHWPYESASEYPRGPIWFFVGVLPMLVGPFVFPAMWIGMWRSLWHGRLAHEKITNTGGTPVLLAALPLAILVGHSLLFWLGKLSSSGSPRYLLIVAPLWGCLTARGWEWVFDAMNWRRTVSWAALAVVLPGLVNYCYRVLPIQQEPSWGDAERFARWYQASPIREKYPRVMSNHPGIFFYLDANPWDRRRVEPWTAEAIDHPPAGVVLIWDPEFSVRNSDPRMVIGLDRVVHAGWINDCDAEWKSDVNEPSAPLGQPVLKTPGMWHIFLSPAHSR